jgi:ferredoxin
MDIKKVGDHECIQCGACISVCPAKAITWKGSKFFVRAGETDVGDAMLKPLTSFLKKVEVEQAVETETQNQEVQSHDVE